VWLKIIVVFIAFILLDFMGFGLFNFKLQKAFEIDIKKAGLKIPACYQRSLG